MTFPVSLHCTGRKLAYARVSTIDQHLDMQVDALRGAGCDQLFQDHGISGTRAKRPGLDDLLNQARAGDMVMVYRLDRLGRSVQHLSNLLTHFNDTGIHFCSLSEGINTTTPGGRLIYHVISAIAEFERERSSSNARFQAWKLPESAANALEGREAFHQSKSPMRAQFSTTAA